MKNIKIFEQVLKDDENQTNGKIAILVGGFNSDSPIKFMDSAVSKYVGDELYNQFIEIRCDNPWTRIVISNINNIKFRDMEDEDSLKVTE